MHRSSIGRIFLHGVRNPSKPPSLYDGDAARFMLDQQIVERLASRQLHIIVDDVLRHGVDDVVDYNIASACIWHSILDSFETCQEADNADSCFRNDMRVGVH